MQHHKLDQYLPCYVFLRDCIVFRYFPTHVHPTKVQSNPTQLPPLYPTMVTCGGGAANSKEGSPQMARTSAANSSSSGNGSRAWGQNTGYLATKCSVSRAMGEVSQKNTPLVLDEKVCTPAYHSRRTMSRLYEFKEDYVKILWRNQLELPKMPQISQAYIANPRPQGQVLMSFLKIPVHSSNRKKIKLTNAPLDYHQLSCQDSIWFIIIYNLNNYIEIHYSIDSYCECTLSKIYLWMCNHYPMSNWHWNILQKSDVNSHESLPQWAPKKCCYPWNSVYVISKCVKVHV